MSKSQSLRNKLLGNKVNHIDYTADRSGTQSSGVGMGVQDVQRNPKFVSQFDINITQVYSNVTLSTVTDAEGNSILYTESVDAANPLDLGDLPIFLFGNSDFQSGYKNAKQQLSLPNYNYGTPIVVKSKETFHSVTTVANDNPISFKSLAVKLGKATIGDVIIPVTKVATGDPQVCEIVINCKQVGYGTLLAALSSDRFKINMIRYKIPNLEKTAQYEKNLQLLRQSLFGKITTDFVSPAAYQNPEQFQQGIVDIPLVKGMDKESVILSYMNYDVGEILLSFYVESQDKLVQEI